ncbi:DMT family transporter [Vineibacter terrae]|uniref:DMT family transporter n=1 Tax=Vineibacter terrae TaxID=2586908 RepID=UPI0015B647AF|nr:DMT family transporter [Vineibacter terrae]
MRLPAMSLIDPVGGIYNKIMAIALLSTMDAMVKGLDAHYPTLQVMFCRSLFGLLPQLWLIQAAGGWQTLATRQPLLQSVRVAASLLSLYGFFYLFPLMPLAELYAISFAAPLFMTALGVPLLGERVGWRRWSAVGVGFAGVLIIVQPGSAAFHPLSLAVLAATLCYALSMICVRRLSRTDSDQTTITIYSLAAIGVSGLIIVTNAVAGEPLGTLWVWPTAIDWLWMLALGVIGGLGQILVTRAWRLAPAAVLAPFDYISIVFALGYGWLFWREIPTPWLWGGLPLIIGSGLYILHRERVRARERIAGA